MDLSALGFSNTKVFELIGLVGLSLILFIILLAVIYYITKQIIPKRRK